MDTTKLSSFDCRYFKGRQWAGIASESRRLEFLHLKWRNRCEDRRIERLRRRRTSAKLRPLVNERSFPPIGSDLSPSSDVQICISRIYRPISGVSMFQTAKPTSETEYSGSEPVKDGDSHLFLGLRIWACRSAFGPGWIKESGIFSLRLAGRPSDRLRQHRSGTFSGALYLLTEHTEQTEHPVTMRARGVPSGSVATEQDGTSAQ